MQTKGPKILYFISGPVPNASNNKEAQAYRSEGATVVFRNARFDDGAMEECQGVLGGDAIPERYRKAPTGEDAIKQHRDKMKEQTDKEAAIMAATGQNEDNMGSHSLPSLSTIPVAASVRPAPPLPAAPGASAIPAVPAAAPGASTGAPAAPGNPFAQK